MGAAIWTFLNSQLGLSLILAGAAWLWRKVVKDDKRRARIAELAREAFEVAEITGAYDKLDGRGKYKVFIETILKAMQAEKLGELTGPEHAVLQEMAARAAWIRKPSPAK